MRAGEFDQKRVQCPDGLAVKTIRLGEVTLIGSNGCASVHLDYGLDRISRLQAGSQSQLGPIQRLPQLATHAIDS